MPVVSDDLFASVVVPVDPWHNERKQWREIGRFLSEVDDREVDFILDWVGNSDMTIEQVIIACMENPNRGDEYYL